MQAAWDIDNTVVSICNTQKNWYGSFLQISQKFTEFIREME